MDLKPYIAVFFAVVFFGKFLMMDSKVLEFILDSTEIAYVNPFCKKQKPGLDENGFLADFSPDSPSLTIAIDSFCNAPFHIEKVQWEHIFVKHIFQHYPYTSPNPPQIFRDSFYPPPKIV